MLPNPTFPRQQVISLFTIMIWVVLFAVGLWLMVLLRALIPPFLVSLIAAMTLTPLVDQLERRGYRRGLAIGIIYFLFLCGLCLIMKGLYAVATGDVKDLVLSLIPNEVKSGGAEGFSNYLSTSLTKHHVPDFLRVPLVTQSHRLPDLGTKVLATIPDTAGNVAWVLLVPIITFFLLLDFDKILGKLLILVAAQKREDLLLVVQGIIAVFGNYVRGVLLVMILDIVVIYLVVLAAGMGKYASVLSISAGMLYTVPYFGAFVSTVTIGLVAYATRGLVTALIVTAAMIFIHQFVFDNIIAPRVIGGSVNLHPLLTLAALLAGGTLFGLGGTLLAVPIAAAMQVILIQIYPQLKLDVRSMTRLSEESRKVSDAKAEDIIEEEQQNPDDETHVASAKV